MEDHLMDELYGDLAANTTVVYPHNDEDSVDIYSGLENSPKGDGNKRNVNIFLSPRTIESMDMYEEIIREEQEEKQATYNELRQKFEAAQIQVKELLSRLQLLETKNSSLNSENMLLKKNICSLIKTARMEIVRKDEEITRLSNRSGRGSYAQIFHQSSMEIGQANVRHSLKNTSRSVLENRDGRQNNVTHEVNKPKSIVLGKTTALAVPTQPFEVLQRCPRNTVENPLNLQNKNCAARSDSETIKPDQEHGHLHPNRTSETIKHLTVPKDADVSNSQKPSNAGPTVPNTTSKTVSKSCHSTRVDILEKSQEQTNRDKKCNLHDKDVSSISQKKVEGNLSKSGRTERELIKDMPVSSESTNNPPEVTVIHKRSGRSKSPSSQSNKALSTEVSFQSFKSSLKTAADVETQNQEHSQDPDRTIKGTGHSGWRSTTCPVMGEASHSQENKMEKLESSDHQKKEEKRQGASSSVERRSSRTEKHRNHEQKRLKDSDRTKRDESHSGSRERRSNRSDSSKEYEKRSVKEADEKCKEGRSRKQVDALDNKQGKDVCKEKASSRKDESLNRKKSHSQENSKKKVFRSPYKKVKSDKYGRGEKGVPKDKERKKDRGCEEPGQKGGKSKNLVLNKDDQKDSFPSNPCKTKDDNSPDRKLSFMETLNLTLSPLKKQRSSSDVKEPVGATAEDASVDNSGISELGEEFLVIDELQNSQQSVEMMVEDSIESKTIDQQDASTSFSKQVDEFFAVVTSEKSSANETNMEVHDENVAEIQEAVDKVPAINKTPEKNLSETLNLDALDKDSLSALNLAGASQNCHNITEDSMGITDNPVASNSLSTEVSENMPDLTVDGCQKQHPIITVPEDTFKLEVRHNSQSESQDLLPAQSGIGQENASEKSCNISKHNFSESSVSLEASSSTFTVDPDDQSKFLCNVEVSTSKQDNEREINTPEILKHVELSEKMTEKSHQSPLRSPNTTAASDNTTVREEITSSMQASFSEPDSIEKDDNNLKSSCFDVLSHDEDSMMLTLRNIKVIPEAISPLTSPVRQVKGVQPHRADKQPHVKSLSKDLSAITSDKVNMEMNKENESPDSSVTSASQKVTVDAISVGGIEEEELEDGEIVSESEEEGPLFIQTPPREMDKSTSASHSSPKLSSVGKRVSQKKSCAPVRSEQSKSSVSPASSGSPTSNKRRFKTVNLPLKSAVHTWDEFMDSLAKIKIELRRKYMKLHKNVSKTAFCSIVDMSQASFTEYVNAVDLDKLCHQGKNIKVKLNKIICSILGKVTKNGIVNRIFDQKAVDLKQKLWKFVDGQFDFLFKELKAALKNSSEPSVNACSAEDKNTTAKENHVVEKDIHRAKKAKVDAGNSGKEVPPIKLPHRGLGSRGKNIKAVMKEDDEVTKVKTSHQLPTSSPEKSVRESTSVTEIKTSSCTRHLSNNGSSHDKSDLEIFTEQQASSLTFNLVSDSQMGEIFKCLLQGSDLLEPSIPVGDNQCWPVSTPRKEEAPGDSLVGIMTPYKTPSKFITSWSSISPYKFASNSKILVDPAILDESCLLEVPSSFEPSQVSAQSTVVSQRTFSILAEDLAVSLTIPSPLKSDSHLSFLHPGTGQPLSAPNSIMSTHYSEDALDGEDQTEQDIHLSLDTDNSSCGSSPSRTWEEPDPSGFQFKPNLPMQAVVMERSNDHFIVRIRHTSTSPQEKSESGLTVEQPNLNRILSPLHEDLGPTHRVSLDKNLTKATESGHVSDKTVDAHPSSQKCPSEDVFDEGNKAKQVCNEANVTPKESNSAETKTTVERVSRKRKEHHSDPKAKRSKTVKSQDKHHKSRHKKRSRSPKEKSSKAAVSPVSPSSLSAKNVIRKKGEVVVTWTRDEDRDILVELKMKGASPKTFAALSKRLKKSSEQIEERFAQLLKLFKKKEKMET
nr:CASP8-associated protein 2 [Misgurnus anguillicaudatus]XP_055042752.1 CASP8-associated protein 2 [Misgurnus anguillicaudatus]